MSNKIVYLLIIFSFGLSGCSGTGNIASKIDEVMNNNVPDKTTTELVESGQSAESIKDAMPVDDLLRSGKPAGEKVKVIGRAGDCVSVQKTADYEGPNDGCKILGEQGELVLDNNEISKMKDKILVVSGKVKYCGGKKKLKVLCELTEAKIEK